MNAEVPAFLRLFIALAVPPEVRAEIGRAQARLQRQTPRGALRWAPVDQFHITLKFLGDVAADQVGPLKDSLRQICAAAPGLRLSAQGMGFFPNARHPRVVWAGARDADNRLPGLHRQIDAALRWLAPAEPSETFSGHITLGRFKPGSHAAIPRVLALAAELGARHFGDWEAAEVQLIRSELTAARAEHRVLAAYPLSGGRSA